jgi:hypothetical protein
MGLAFAFASVLPDLDVIFMAGGRRFYLKNHQGPTHSVWLAPAMALIPAGFWAWGVQWDLGVYLAALAGLGIHAGLDAANTFGLRLFWPFGRRYALDILFFIDLWAWGLTSGFLALRFGWGIHGIGPAWIGLWAGYLGFRWFLGRRVRKTLTPDAAIPSAWNPFDFYIFERTAAGRKTYQYNVLTHRIVDEQTIPPASETARMLAEQSPAYRDIKRMIRALEVVDERWEGGLRVIEARDLAVRNFGGRFGRVDLRFDREGNLVHEMAHI